VTGRERRIYICVYVYIHIYDFMGGTPIEHPHKGVLAFQPSTIRCFVKSVQRMGWVEGLISFIHLDCSAHL
jgi:hypothetical protein